MKLYSMFRQLGPLLAGLCISLPAFATWDGEMIASGTPLEDLQSATITFETGGEQLPVEVREDDDGNVLFVIGFAGNSATPGTLSISGPGGTQRISTPAAAPGQNIYVDTTGPGSASTLRPASTASAPASVYFPTHQVSLDLGYRNFQGSDIATANTTIPAGGPGNEFPTLSADYDVGTIGGTLSYAYNTGGSLPGWLDRTGYSSNLTIGGSYSNYSGDDDSTVNDTQLLDRGYLLTALAPAPDDTTGPFYGPGTASSFAELDVDFQRFEGFLEWLCNRDAPGDSFYRSRVDFGYSQWDLDLQSNDIVEATIPATGTNNRWQSIDQDIWDIGVGTTLINPLRNNFDVFAGAMLRLYYSEADLESREEFLFAAGFPEGSRSVQQSDDSTDLGLDLNFGAGWNFADNWRAEAEAVVRFNVPSASIANPISGDGSNPGPDVLPRTSINYDNETLWGIQVGVKYAF